MIKFFFSLVMLSLSTSLARAHIYNKVSEESDTTHMTDLVVTGSRTVTTSRSLPMTVSVVDNNTLTQHQRINILPTLSEQIPGLFLTQRGMMGFGVSGGAAGGITMRGISSGSGQLLVLIDGHPQYQGIYGHSISDSYQTLMAERVEVLRGPASVLYGSNAMGGVINIVTKGPEHDGVRTHLNLGAGSWGTFQGDLSNSIRKGAFSSHVAFQYSRSDNHRPNMGFEQYGGFVKLGYEINTHWNTFADVDLTHFNSSFPGTTDAPMLEADQWITRGVATLGVENHYGCTDGRVSVYHNWGNHKINDGYALGKTPLTRYFRSKDALTGVSWYQNARLWQGGHVTLGFDYQHIFGHAYYTDRETGEEVATTNKQSAEKNMDEVAAYVNLQQRIVSWLALNAGLRFDHHSVAGNEWVPQAGVVFTPLRHADIKFMASKGFRNPSLREMYLYLPSNDELRAERIWNYELSWSHRLRHVRYGVNLFWLKGDNMIQQVIIKENGSSKKRNVNTGEMENCGLEVEANWRINSHWSLQTNHAYLHMEHPVLAAPEYKGYLSASMNYGQWTASVGLQQICGLYSDVNPQKELRENFTLLNATIGYQLLPQLRLWAKGDNLLAQRYSINVGCPMPRTTFIAGVNVSF